MVLFREMRKIEGGKGFGGWKSLKQEFSVKSEISVNYLHDYVKWVVKCGIYRLTSVFFYYSLCAKFLLASKLVPSCVACRQTG